MEVLVRSFSSRGEKSAKDVLTKEQKLVGFYQAESSRYLSSDGLFFANMGTRFSPSKSREFSKSLQLSRESTEDTVFKYLMEASSSWLSRPLKKLSPLNLDRMIRLTSYVQRKEARFMDFALGGPSEFSIPRFYDGDTAARALARVVSPLAIFLLWLLVKTVHSAKHDEAIARKNMKDMARLRQLMVSDNDESMAKAMVDVGSQIEGIRMEVANDRETFSEELKKKKDREG
ncbi:unnamed protein product [Microthlaspi erraticum]|uniref:Uncharacterized protein n=1 Tax=Microthlaspi erraticum TaxID=1685480 RepID=A0A6D2HRB0_9BRAS|nr:unnamed protein product [Microthlaspi erraticum]